MRCCRIARVNRQRGKIVDDDHGSGDRLKVERCAAGLAHLLEVQRSVACGEVRAVRPSS